MICRKHPEQYSGVPCAKCIAEAWSDDIVDEPKETEALKCSDREKLVIAVEALQSLTRALAQSNEEWLKATLKMTLEAIGPLDAEFFKVGEIFQETESTLFAKEHGIAASAEEIKKAWPQNHREHVVLLLDERDSMQARIAALTALVTARESEITEVLKELKELRQGIRNSVREVLPTKESK